MPMSQVFDGSEKRFDSGWVSSVSPASGDAFPLMRAQNEFDSLVYSLQSCDM